MTHRSSAQPATLGNNSLTSRPDCPCLANLNGEARHVLVLYFLTSLETSRSIGLPLSRARRGLGSNVSTCDGPPGMKRKMTRLARAAKWGSLTVRGLEPAAGASIAPTDDA